VLLTSGQAPSFEFDQGSARTFEQQLQWQRPLAARFRRINPASAPPL